MNDLLIVAGWIGIVVAGANVLGLFFRWRGQAEDRPLWPTPWIVPWLPRRALCGAVVALPVLGALPMFGSATLPLLPWPEPVQLGWAGVAGAFLLAAIGATIGVGRAHGRGLDLGRRHGTPLGDVLFLSWTGALYVAAPAALQAALGNWQGALVQLAGGLAKGPCYALADAYDRRWRRNPGEHGKYLTREVLFGAVAGGTSLAGLAMQVL